MSNTSLWLRIASAAVGVGLFTPAVEAGGKKGGGGHTSAPAPHASAMHVAHSNMNVASPHASTAQNHTNSAYQPTSAMLGTSNPALSPLGGQGAGGYGSSSGYNKRGYGSSNRGYRNSGGYRGRNNNNNNGAIVSSLHSALNTLTQASHDYQGHRARAMHEIGNAIHSLQPNSSSGRGMSTNPTTAFLNQGVNNNGNGLGNGNGNNANRQPQATSDRHMRTALQSLNSVHNRLTAYGSTSHHVRARSSVQKAAQELQVALNIR